VRVACANIIIESQFCASDGPAIQALAMIGHSNAGISMETLLKKLDIQTTTRILH